jgi:hypothetical protein
MIGMNQADQAERSEQRADRHDAMPAVTIDEQPYSGRNQPGREQCQRQARHGERP